MRRTLLVLCALLLPILHDTVPHDSIHEALAQAGFSFTFDGSPAAPQPWRPTSWDVQRNNADAYRQINDGDTGLRRDAPLSDCGR